MRHLSIAFPASRRQVPPSTHSLLPRSPQPSRSAAPSAATWPWCRRRTARCGLAPSIGRPWSSLTQPTAKCTSSRAETRASRYGGVGAAVRRDWALNVRGQRRRRWLWAVSNTQLQLHSRSSAYPHPNTSRHLARVPHVFHTRAHLTHMHQPRATRTHAAVLQRGGR